MDSNSPIKKYFFLILFLFLIYLGAFFYFFDIHEGISYYGTPFALSFVSFIINIAIIISLRLKNRRKIAALVIYELLYISCLQEFSFFKIGIVFLLLSIIMLLLLDVFPSFYYFKYFNVGVLTTISFFLYYPVGILLILFFVTVVLYYEEKINISQYLAGILFTVLLSLEMAYLLDGFHIIAEWVKHLEFPTFHYEYQVPVVIFLLFIIMYGIYNQYSTKYATEEIEIANRYSSLILYVFTWMIIYLFFMGNNYGLLIFVSLPISLIVPRNL